MCALAAWMFMQHVCAWCWQNLERGSAPQNWRDRQLWAGPSGRTTVFLTAELSLQLCLCSCSLKSTWHPPQCKRFSVPFTDKSVCCCRLWWRKPCLIWLLYPLQSCLLFPMFKLYWLFSVSIFLGLPKSLPAISQEDASLSLPTPVQNRLSSSSYFLCNYGGFIILYVCFFHYSNNSKYVALRKDESPVPRTQWLLSKGYQTENSAQLCCPEQENCQNKQFSRGLNFSQHQSLMFSWNLSPWIL